MVGSDDRVVELGKTEGNNDKMTFCAYKVKTAYAIAGVVSVTRLPTEVSADGIHALIHVRGSEDRGMTRFSL